MILERLKSLGIFLLGLLLAVGVAFGVGKGKGRREERQEADLANAKRDAVVQAGEERRETDHQVQGMEDDEVREELRRDWTRR